MYLSRKWFVEAKKNQTIAAENDTLFRWTDSELDLVEETLKDNEKWMKEMMAKQEALEEDPTSDPVLLTADLQLRGKRVQNIVSQPARPCYNMWWLLNQLSSLS
jgi:hypoxia up-regulated 1